MNRSKPNRPKPPGNGIVVLGRCMQETKPFGVRFEERNGVWMLHWSFTVSSQESSAGQKSGKKISGAFDIAPDYKGCPYCHARCLLFCGCGKAICWDGKQTTITCPTCRAGGTVTGGVGSITGGGGR